MAKETPVVQNSKMLALSLGLALLVVVLYNVQINKIRTEAKGTTVLMLQYKMNKHAGDTISDRDDLQAAEVDEKLAKGLKNVKTDDDRNTVVGHRLAHGVAAGDWVMRDDLADQVERSIIVPPHEGMVTVPIDPTYSPGRMLHLGDRVNLLGEVQATPGHYKTMRLIDGLIVRSIGGKSVTDFAKPGEDSSSSYREIGISLPRDMIPKWYNVLSYVKGGRVIIELRNPSDLVPELVINPELNDKLEKADPTHGSYMPSGGGSMAPPL
jgi:hypothetical protein